MPRISGLDLALVCDVYDLVKFQPLRAEILFADAGIRMAPVPPMPESARARLIDMKVLQSDLPERSDSDVQISV